VLLPDGRGTELLTPDNQHRSFPAVIMTSFGDEHSAVVAMKAGALDYVVKSNTSLSDMPHIAERAMREWENIVGRREAQKRLRLLSSAVEQSTEGIAVVDLGGNLLFLNEAFAAMHGYALEELQDKHLSTFHTPEQMPAVDSANLKTRETGQFNGEIWHVRRDGTAFPALMHNSLLRDESGDPVGMIGTARDITDLKQVEIELAKHRDHLEELVEERTSAVQQTNRQLEQEIAERKRAEGALRESERRSRAILDHTFQFIGLMTLDGVLIEANRASLEFAGIEEDQVLGQPFWETPWWQHSAELQAQLRKAVQSAAAGEFVRFEATHPAQDGTLHYVDFSLKPVFDESGKVSLLIPEGRDVTERKRAEQAVQQERLLLRRMLDLQERERKLVAYDIHDGLAQQLTGAMLQFQTLRQLQHELPDLAQKAIQAGLGLLEEGLGEARRLIGGLRPPILDESGVVAAIDYLICEYQKQEGPKIEFHHDVSFDRLAAPLETAVFRVIQAALTNACRHSQSPRICVELTDRDGHLLVEIRDWGIGFDVDGIGEDRFGVRGIRERARLLGGRAVFETAPNEGTRVIVDLPLLENVPEGVDVPAEDAGA